MVDLGYRPIPPEELVCTGKDGQERTFYVDYQPPSPDSDGWHFRVHRKPTPDEADHWFDLSFKPFGQEWRSHVMDAASKPHYRSKGIPEALLLYARRVIGTPIVSSREGTDDDEYFEESARKAWQRAGATLDPKLRRYRLP